MAAFDQSFIKAFHQSRSGARAQPAAATVPLSEALELLDRAPADGASPGAAPHAEPPAENADPSEVVLAQPAAKRPGASTPLADLLSELRNGPPTTPAVSLATHAEPAGAAARTVNLTVVHPQDAEPAAAAPREAAIEPGLEVEHFVWPAVCEQLQGVAGAELDRLAQSLLALSPEPGRVVAVAGCRRGEGATTVLLCTAARLAALGQRTIVVDADLEDAHLAQHLGLAPELGWADTLDGRLPLADVIVHSLDDQLDLLPLCEPVACSEATRRGLSQALELLRGSYDVLLVNLAPVIDARDPDAVLAQGAGRQIDLMMLVQDARLTSHTHLDEVCQRLHEEGVQQLALAENFACV